LVAAVNLFERLGDFAERGAGAGGSDGEFQQVAGFGFGGVGQGG